MSVTCRPPGFTKPVCVITPRYAKQLTCTHTYRNRCKHLICQSQSWAIFKTLCVRKVFKSAVKTPYHQLESDAGEEEVGEEELLESAVWSG